MSDTRIAPRQVGRTRLSSFEAMRVRDLLAARGESFACAHFGLSRIAVARAAAGLVMNGATVFAIRDGLRRVDDEAGE